MQTLTVSIYTTSEILKRYFQKLYCFSFRKVQKKENIFRPRLISIKIDK